FRVEGARMRLVIHRGPLDAAKVGTHTIPIDRRSVNGEAVLQRRTVHVRGLKAGSRRAPPGRGRARPFGMHTTPSAALCGENIAMGVLVLRRAEIRPFSNEQIALLETFADQAVIAIENVRLFTELQASNRDLTTALDKQTAMSDILRVISQSPTDVQPV